MTKNITQKLIKWYLENARSMPWRDNPDPYAVWVAETMLQQTRVETVKPYFERWMTVFPTLQSLAEADLMQVLNLWEGLGYYSRARNLHKAAKIVINDFNYLQLFRQSRLRHHFSRRLDLF